MNTTHTPEHVEHVAFHGAVNCAFPRYPRIDSMSELARENDERSGHAGDLEASRTGKPVPMYYRGNGDTEARRTAERMRLLSHASVRAIFAGRATAAPTPTPAREPVFIGRRGGGMGDMKLN